MDIDVVRWPIVVVTPPPVPLTDESLEAFIEEWLRIIKPRSERYVCVQDLRHVPHMSAAHRRRMTDWMNSAQEDLAAKCVGTAMIFDSMLLRGALTAVLWMFRPPYPTEVFKAREDALEWARRRLDQAG